MLLLPFASVDSHSGNLRRIIWPHFGALAITHFTFACFSLPVHFLWPLLFVCESLVAYIYYLANVS